MAEPGQNWQATDVISGPPLPGRRLIWAATVGDYSVVHYETGGIAHICTALVASLGKGGKPTVLWRRDVGPPLKDYDAFLATLKSGKL